jgi:hypothetical protein
MDGQENKPGEAKPGGEVLKTAGEASAAAYAEGEVPDATDCPTIEVDRVRIVSPTQTPTVKLADRAKGSGPRAPDQMVKPTPKGPVELPEGRPVTKMQVIEIDPEFLLELETRRKASTGGTAQTEAEAHLGPTDSPWVKEAPAQPRAAELPSAGGPPSAPVSTEARERSSRGAVLVAAAVLLTALVLGMAATRGPRAEEKAATSAAVTTTATVASTTAEPLPSVVPSAAVVAPPSTVPSITATASASAPQAIRPPGKAIRDGGDPYGPAVTPIPPKTAPEPPPPAPSATGTSVSPPSDPKALQPAIKF